MGLPLVYGSTIFSLTFQLKKPVVHGWISRSISALKDESQE